MPHYASQQKDTTMVHVSNHAGKHSFARTSKGNGMKLCILCTACGHTLDGMGQWFAAGQHCPACRSSLVSVQYRTPCDATFLSNAFSAAHTGIWRYLDRLPLLNPENILPVASPSVSMERWTFLEERLHSQHGLGVEIWAHRHDESVPTGSFKDLAATVIASALKEHAVPAYVVASTGNFSLACALHLKRAGIRLHAFLPATTPAIYADHIQALGQHAHIVPGDYAEVKRAAQEYADQHKIMHSAGTTDPLRIEAKKTIAYEWARLLPVQPTVYVQALSGGTGPIGVYQGAEDLLKAGLFDKLPRFILVQSDQCSPMADAWQRAEAKGFPDNWETHYEVVHNPQGKILALLTGNPTMYSVVANLVQKTQGAIIRFPEDQYLRIISMAASRQGVFIGPAAAVAVGGLLSAAQEGRLVQNDKVVVNVGEGMRYAPHLFQELSRIAKQSDL